jgi:hypothetical protein
MSVCISAILSHQWPTYSGEAINEIARATSPESGVLHSRPISESGSPELDYTSYGSALFRLPGDFTLRFGRASLVLDHDDRWSALLMHRNVRQRFLSACKRVARVTGAEDVILLPEGTELEDSFQDSMVFNEIQERATLKFGPPDLDISRYYSEDEVTEMSGNRVHYFVVKIAGSETRH